MIPGILSVKIAGNGTGSVTPGSQTYSSAGTYSWTVPKYNTLTVEMWGGGGEGCGVTAFTMGGTTDAGQSGGDSTFKGMVAGGGVAGTSRTGGGTGGTATGGTTNTVGGNGDSGDSTAGRTVNSGAGGDSPNGGAGAARVQRTTDGTSSGANGAAPGGGGSGAVTADSSYDSRLGITSYFGLGGRGGGGGGYVKRTYTVGASGAPVPGSNETVVVGAGGSSNNGGNGATGRVILTWS